MKNPSAPAHIFRGFTFTSPNYSLNIEPRDDTPSYQEAIDWFKSQPKDWEVGGKPEKKTIFEQTIEKPKVEKENKGDINGDGKFDEKDLKLAGEALNRGRGRPKK
jgi:hypothetical protein